MNLADITIRAAVAADTKAMSALAYRAKKSNGHSEQAMEKFADGLRVTPNT